MAWVYILTNQPRGTLYVGVTNDLVRRMYQHREGGVRGFTQRYGLKMLVHLDAFRLMPMVELPHFLKKWITLLPIKLMRAVMYSTHELFHQFH